MSSVAREMMEPARAANAAASASAITLVARQVSGADWDTIIGSFDEVCQEQTHAFAKTRWPDVGQEPVIFQRGATVVGGALVMIQPLPLGLGKMAVVKWAPMLASAGSAEAEALRAAMVDCLTRDYAEKRGMMLSVLLHASPDEINAGYHALRQRGFQRGSTLLFPNRYMVRLRLSDDDLRKSFHQTWRRQLNKAEKSNLEFSRSEPGEIGDFKALYAAMTERKQFPDHSAYETLDVLMGLDEPLRPELFFVRHEGETVAGALIFKAGQRAVYLYGATNDKALPLRAGYFLHWQVIRWLRDNARAQWYDLGGTDGFQGLHQFKAGMVGTAGVIRPVPPVLNRATSPWAGFLGNAAFTARDVLQHTRRHLDGLRSSKARPDQAPHIWDESFR
ncbi:peptidoglycan bridge formation glycyltransferase FemA/FemB family protein [Devosia sp.]|uniref:lipid II:glycine glycyltransferase FemX n=1 Tax=Devosia sp. TaxID=1871048 RepID=UPI001AD4360B|nr:peptidoglycan bridge formation glycyltransferase FemA/FemB family protein [Devosia sp.]MBN9335328.1 peptidoglycan bridge formation glycyltransferase FemA/FemB family protein [Devosia sp.]